MTPSSSTPSPSPGAPVDKALSSTAEETGSATRASPAFKDQVGDLEATATATSSPRVDAQQQLFGNVLVPVAHATPVTRSQIFDEEQQRLERRNQELQLELDRQRAMMMIVHPPPPPPECAATAAGTTLPSNGSLCFTQRQWTGFVKAAIVVVSILFAAIVGGIVGSQQHGREAGAGADPISKDTAAPSAQNPVAMAPMPTEPSKPIPTRTTESSCNITASSSIYIVSGHGNNGSVSGRTASPSRRM